ncbi:response regulator transcription factor [Aquibacillus koreensis]|uniref:Response regulator transcription factor n=1 Tax=Aquibacillus koreensis TaxID=279446 RepID=A0A9X3WJW9_9BACI|nr:response regulator transcription factor [Aquibacillus koreensis]MCT2537044.1 response regulator transcription factor [Aquibacillus koreensis]MDC3419973.1 response regulator transcription factor [Aquibacillus koreensis]
MSDLLKVFIAEDDAFFRSGMELVINAEPDMHVVGIAANGTEALEKMQEAAPHVVLMDVKMPKMNGIDCIKRLKAAYPEIVILILTTFNEEEYIIEGLVNGANGYLIKGIDFKLLTNTIRDVARGQYMLPTEVATKLATYLVNNVKKKAESTLPKHMTGDFTEKESQIMMLLAERYTNKEIADKLTMSVGTIKNYLTVIYEKLQVKNRQEAASILRKLVD